MIIAEAGPWSDYLSTWEACMRGVHLFDEDRFFDYTREEETRKLEEQFDEEDNIFLVTLDPHPTGFLGIRVNGDQGTMRRARTASSKGGLCMGIPPIPTLETFSPVLPNLVLFKAQYPRRWYHSLDLNNLSASRSSRFHKLSVAAC